MGYILINTDFIIIQNVYGGTSVFEYNLFQKIVEVLQHLKTKGSEWDS